MFDIGWTELLLIGVVALIVVGPKDLPAMFHTLGRFVARAKGMAREFQNAMNEAAREAGVDEVAKDLKNATSARSMGLDKLQDAATKFENWDPTAPGAAKGEGASDTPVSTTKPATKKAATKKAATKKPAAKKPATKKTAARKTAAKPAARTGAAKTAAAKKTAPKAAPKAAPKTAPKAAAKPARKPAAGKAKS